MQSNQDKAVSMSTENIQEDIADRNTGIGKIVESDREISSVDVSPTGGDMDTNAYQASVVGEEAVGGLTPTPGQNDVDKLGNALGLEFEEGEELGVKNKLDKRDAQRPELNPDENR